MHKGQKCHVGGGVKKLRLAVEALSLKLDCNTCTETQQRLRGCNYEVRENEFEFEDQPLTRCPLKLITRQSVDYIRFHNYLEKGFLPNGGSIMEQPSKFLEAHEIISSTLFRIDEKERRNKK